MTRNTRARHPGWATSDVVRSAINQRIRSKTFSDRPYGRSAARISEARRRQAALGQRQIRAPKGAIFHSDRGSNYTSAEFGKVLHDYGIEQSVGRTGICYDNAMAESFFAALKNERINRTQYPTRKRRERRCPL
jgi:transposase InsO family protein